jgi:hypothetical protein
MCNKGSSRLAILWRVKTKVDGVVRVASSREPSSRKCEHVARNLDDAGDCCIEGPDAVAHLFQAAAASSAAVGVELGRGGGRREGEARSLSIEGKQDHASEPLRVRGCCCAEGLRTDQVRLPLSFNLDDFFRYRHRPRHRRVNQVGLVSVRGV